ncbi:hypothetical protein LTR95_009560 [Oleoguttula sp. CCFEE 5521]
MAVTTLDEIPTIADSYQSGDLVPASQDDPQPNATSTHNSKISLVRTDITKLAVDAIVNAANESLLGGGGVDGAIHRAAGPDLVDECEELDGCDTGDAKITGAYELPCKKVIHAVGPVYHTRKRQGTHTKLLQSCYTRSLDLMVESGCRSIAFSALSTGVYGYPSEEAAEGALGAAKGWLDEDVERSGKVDRIVFCSFLEKDEKAYEKLVPRFFPSPTGFQEERNVKDDEAAKEAGKTPDLPDVPTQDPAEHGLPDAKKRKLNDRKMLCKQMRDMAPRPSERHIRTLLFPTTGSKPRLVWVRGQSPGSRCAWLEISDVEKKLMSKGMGSGSLRLDGSTPKTAPSLLVHFSTEGGHLKNAMLEEWVGERMKHYTPGPVLVSGRKSDWAEGDVHRDFEMEDMRLLKIMLQCPLTPEALERLTQGARDSTGWYRM